MFSLYPSYTPAAVARWFHRLALLICLGLPSVAAAAVTLDNVTFTTGDSGSMQWGGEYKASFHLANTSATMSAPFSALIWVELADGTASCLIGSWGDFELLTSGMPGNTATTPTIPITLPPDLPQGFSAPANLRLRIQLSINVGTVFREAVSAPLGPIAAAPLADLSGAKFSLQQTAAVWGAPVGILLTVQNAAGRQMAGASNVAVCLSRTGQFALNSPDCAVLQVIPCSSLYGGDTASIRSYVNIGLPAANPFGGTNTTFYVGMIVDSSNAVAESDESNNANQGAGLDSGEHAITITNPMPIMSLTDSVAPPNDNQLDFGEVAVDGDGGAMGTQTVSISDSGFLPLRVSNIAVSSGPFHIAAITSNIQQLPAVPYATPIAAEGAETWVVTVTYDPTAVGTQTGTLTVTTNDPARPSAVISLSGTGRAVAHVVLTDPVDPPTDLKADFGGTVNDGLGGASSTLDFTLNNTGSGPLTVSANGVTLTDTAGGVWSLVSVQSSTQGAISAGSGPRTLAPYGAETWTIRVKFDPVALTSYASALQVASDDPNLPLLTCTLLGRGLIPMTLAITDSIGLPNDRSMDFGSAHATGKQKKPGVVTLQNTGEVALPIAANGIALTNGTDFHIKDIQSSTAGTIDLTTAGASIAPGGLESWTVNLEFAPTTSGARSGQLRVTSSEPTQAVATVALSGNGLNQPGLLLTDDSGVPDDLTIDYGPTLNDGAGGRVGTHTITLTNIGLKPLQIPAHGIASSATPFKVGAIASSTQGAIDLASAGAAIAPDSAESWQVTLDFDPTANGPASGTVTVQNNDPAGPAVVALTGVGETPGIVLLPQGSASTIAIPAGQLYTLKWHGTYTAGPAAISLYRDLDNDPASGLVSLASGLKHDPAGSGDGAYTWRPEESLAGNVFYLYAKIQDGTVSNGSYAARRVQVEPPGAFILISPVVTTAEDYQYQYMYNGVVRTGSQHLEPGTNVVTITTTLPDGSTVVHEVPINRVDSLLATQAAQYDEMGRLKLYTTPNGVTVTYIYDLAGNLKSKEASNGNTVSFGYDNLRRKVSMTDATGWTFYNYDDLDRLEDVIYSSDDVKGNADDRVIHYEYDDANRVQDVTYPGGRKVAYTWDDAGRMLSVQDNTQAKGTVYTYDYTKGLLQTATHANGVVTTYGYDNVGRLNDVKHTIGADVPGAALVAQYTYDLDSMGNAKTLLTTAADGSQKQEKYTYDGVHRLTEVVYGSGATVTPQDRTVSYTYDGIGNRLTQTTKVNGAVTQTLTYNYASENRLLDVTDQNNVKVAEYIYDPAGNRVQKITPTATTYYTYNEGNFLLSVVTPTDYLTYSYNGVGQRVSKTANGVITLYTIDPSRSLFQTIEEWQNNSVTQSHIYGLNRVETHPASGPSQFYLPDRIGSTRLITNSAGAITEAYDYDVFGAAR